MMQPNGNARATARAVGSRPLGSRAVGVSLVVAAAIVVAAGASMATAQTAPQVSPARPTGQTPKAGGQKAAAKSETVASPAAGGEGALRQRVEQLEEQLVEMQVTVGTLDSLAKGGNSSSGVYRGSATDAGSGGDAGRIAALETQVRALATQVDQLSQQLRQANARAPAAAVYNSQPPTATANAATADASDPIGRLVGNGASPQPLPPPAASMPSANASDASTKQAYESAYGFLLQQDFASAEAAFDDFLKRYPNDSLAGNAQYWLGETYFARGQYKPAASAFLKGYQTYARSAKAPDSVLKLAMSLDKLGQKDAACASYAELTAKFPNAPGHVKNRADTERRRLGCS